MNVNDFLNNRFLLDSAIKIFGIVFSALYILFSIVVYRQVKTMHQTLKTSQGGLIIIISFFQVLLSLFVFLVAILIL